MICHGTDLCDTYSDSTLLISSSKSDRDS